MPRSRFVLSVILPAGLAVAGSLAAGCTEGLVGDGDTRDGAGTYADNPKLIQDVKPNPSAATQPAVSVEGGPDKVFASLIKGEPGRTSYTLRNEGDGPLKLGKPQTTCKCTGLDLEKGETLAPGETRVVTLEYVADRSQPEFRQTAFIPTNDPALDDGTGRLELTVRGPVFDLVRVRPGRTLSFGQIDTDEPVELSATLVSRVLTSAELEPTEIVPSIEAVEVSQRPLNEEELAQFARDDGTEYAGAREVTVRLTPGVPIGSLNKHFVKLMLDVDEEKYADYREVVIDITGTKKGPWSFVPVRAQGQKWHPEAQALDLGTFPAEEGRVGRVQVFVTGVEEPLELVSVGGLPEYVTLEFDRDETFGIKDGGRQKGTFVFTVKPGAPPVTHKRGGSNLRIDVKTNHPTAPNLKFYVEMVARR